MFTVFLLYAKKLKFLRFQYSKNDFYILNFNNKV